MKKNLVIFSSLFVFLFSSLVKFVSAATYVYEPIFDFDLDELVKLVVTANPEWINIGADSKKHNLPEPSKEKIKKLITTLQLKTDVKLKDNLKRIMDS